jgi:hypothetical protein
MSGCLQFLLFGLKSPVENYRIVGKKCLESFRVSI